jgi:hypothetical protein
VKPLSSLAHAVFPGDTRALGAPADLAAEEGTEDGPDKAGPGHRRELFLKEVPPK